ncbi:MAG: hypothetical protein EI684_04545 [Candidatus Viridilinea halotolerans]|uniref:Uncharacterized protein n=1 Tax=Candidatus Viridilinea halotolerans TaxID=2491704 RepID=A0A426U666_9CHLR|nr:MAG: hypothetical protein EI684_04545 [Candidatus Viridilinea halotolerans]
MSYEDDPSPAGAGLSPGSMTFSEPCVCIEAQRCPRCGNNLHGPWWRFPHRYLSDGVNTVANAAVWYLLSHQGQQRLGTCFTSLLPIREAMARQDAGKRIAKVVGVKAFAWIVPLQRRISTWLYQSPDEPACAGCGWNGSQEGDLQPFWECTCAWEEDAAAHATSLP